MRNMLLRVSCVALLALTLVLPASAASVNTQAASPWRLALLVGGSGGEYQLIFKGMMAGLADRGLIRNGDVPIPGDDESLEPMWHWLGSKAGGDRIIFVPDAFYSPEWKQEDRAQVRQRLIDRIKNQGDIDCILAFGTWGGQDIAGADLEIPILISSVTNAVEAGIIPSPDDSGRDNLWASIEPDRYARQVRVFHDIVGFSRLGIAYEDTPSGRSGIALAEIEAEAESLGVELVRCKSMFDIEDVQLAADNLRHCHEQLVEQKADAVYITLNTAMNGARIPTVLAPLIQQRLPTFAQQGSEAVKRGVLLSIAQADLQDEGDFSAQALEKVLNGASPRSLSQRYESVFSLAVNLRMATLIGWNLPMEILAAVDEFYENF